MGRRYRHSDERRERNSCQLQIDQGISLGWNKSSLCVCACTLKVQKSRGEVLHLTNQCAHICSHLTSLSCVCRRVKDFIG